MKNKRLLYLPLLFAVLFAAVFVFINHEQAVGQMTIPTRTPVPNNPEPTDDNSGGGGGGGGGDNGGSQPGPTDTPQSSATAVPPSILATNTAVPTLEASSTPRATGTAAATVTIVAEASATADLEAQLDQIAPGSTPVEFPILATAYPTAEPCGEPPTFTTLTTANVYSGPGSDYTVIETLKNKEVRPIVGRAAYSTWWLIQLDGKYRQGWISDKAGTVQGYTGNIPVIDAPSINGALPTPGNEWNPTPAPNCTPTPTPTSDGSVISGSIIDYDGRSSEKVKTAADTETASEIRTELAEAAAPLELDVSVATPTPNLLPIAGLVLVIAAIFVALFLRRSTGGGDAGS